MRARAWPYAFYRYAPAAMSKYRAAPASKANQISERTNAQLPRTMLPGNDYWLIPSAMTDHAGPLRSAAPTDATVPGPWRPVCLELRCGSRQIGRSLILPHIELSALS
jgi:hypothetical protein